MLALGSGMLLGGLATPAAAASATKPIWTLRSIDTMAWSKDQLQNQIPATSIDQLLRTDRGAGANTVAVEVPYDAADTYSPPVTPGYEATWTSAAHALGLHVWFRSHWNNWQGDYGFPIETPTSDPGRALGTAAAVLDGEDTTSYLALTYYWILDNADLFQNGDIFTPAAEPENAGIAPGCQAECMFSSVAVYNQWLQDSMTVDRDAFASLHLQVQVGYWGTSGWIATNGYLSQATVQDMGVLAVDDYFQSPAELVANLSQIEATYHVPLMVGEWGDIWDGGDLSLMVPEVDAIMAAVSQLPNVVGFNYWRDIGETQGEGIVDPTTLQLNSAGQVVASWYSVMSASTESDPPPAVPTASPSPRSAADAAVPATAKVPGRGQLRSSGTGLSTAHLSSTRTADPESASAGSAWLRALIAALFLLLVAGLVWRASDVARLRHWGAGPTIR